MGKPIAVHLFSTCAVMFQTIKKTAKKHIMISDDWFTVVYFIEMIYEVRPYNTYGLVV